MDNEYKDIVLDSLSKSKVIKKHYSKLVKNYKKEQRKKTMKHLIGLLFLLFTSCQSNRINEGFYRCDNSGKSMSLKFKSNNVAYLNIATGMNRFMDTIEWIHERNFIFFTEIDSNYLDYGDSIGLITLPSKALYSKGHILFYMDSTFMIFYKSI